MKNLSFLPKINWIMSGIVLCCFSMSMNLACLIFTDRKPIKEIKTERIAGIIWGEKNSPRSWKEAKQLCNSMYMSLPAKNQLIAVHSEVKYFPGDNAENSSYWSNEPMTFVYNGDVFHADDVTRSFVRCVREQ